MIAYEVTDHYLYNHILNGFIGLILAENSRVGFTLHFPGLELFLNQFYWKSGIVFLFYEETSEINMKSEKEIEEYNKRELLIKKLKGEL